MSGVMRDVGRYNWWVRKSPVSVRKTGKYSGRDHTFETVPFRHMVMEIEYVGVGKKPLNKFFLSSRTFQEWLEVIISVKLCVLSILS